MNSKNGLNLFRRQFVQLGAASLLTLGMAGSAWGAWPSTFGGAGVDEASMVKVGEYGNIYVAGNFEGTIQVGNFDLSATGGQDFFLAKISAGGSVSWVKKFGSANFESVNDIALDSAENIYLTGDFYGATTLGVNQFSSRGDSDIFTLKVNNAGSVQWAESGGGAFADTAVGIGVVEGDKTQIPPVPDYVFIAGTYKGRMTVGDNNTGSTGYADRTVDTTLPNDSTSSGGYIARIDGAGSWDYAKDRQGTTLEGFSALETSSDGRLYLAGFAQTGSSVVWSEDFDGVNYADVNTGVGDGIPDGVITKWDRHDRLPTNWSADSGTIGPGSGGVYWHNLPGVNQYAVSATEQSNYELFIAGRTNRSIYSEVIDTSANNRLSLSLHIWEGRDYFSEDTDYGEDFEVSYKNASGAWKRLTYQYGGGGRTNQVFNFNLPADALHANFQLRFWQRRGSGSGWDYWHVDDIVLSDVNFSPFVTEVFNTLDTVSDLVIDPGVTLPQNINPSALAFYDGSGDTNITPRLYMLADHSGGNASIGGISANLTNNQIGTAIVSFGVEGIGLTAEAAKAVAGGYMRDVTVDTEGQVYVVGDFASSIQFESDLELFPRNSDGSSDIFVVGFGPTLISLWATGGEGDTSNGGLPGYAGGLLEDRASAIAYDGLTGLFVLGDFEDLAIFGDDEQGFSNGETDVFIANLNTDGAWFDVQYWIVGEPIPAPVNAILNDETVLPPDVLVEGELVANAIGRLFYWQRAIGGGAQTPGGYDAILVPLQPVSDVTLRWRTESDPASVSRVTSIGSSAWPVHACSPTSDVACYQIHVASAPVEIEPSDKSFSYMPSDGVILPDENASGGAVTSNVFNASQNGFAVITYVEGPTPDTTIYPVDFEVVRTVAYANAPEFEANVPVEIGKTITDLFHDQPGRTGYVMNENAFYDGLGADAAYKRSARTGQIIPVNELNPARVEDAGKELVVTWYRKNMKNVFWGEKPVLYDPFWSLNPDRIIVASQEGGEGLGQAPLDPLIYTSMTLYRQADPSLPGFNPNDEHALFAPSSTGTGLEAIFALRADFGSPVDQIDAESDPYVLIKYFDTVTSLWAFRVYRVEATGAGFNEFRFTGTAGTTVSPPYPVRLLAGCSQSLVSGQVYSTDPVPSPFFKDYTNQLWSTSSGQGSSFYYYPLQPGFDGPDSTLSDGDCVAWMPKLPTAMGGTADINKPIEVAYDISWPTEVPQLLPGETLLKPKRGLPNIINQAAVQVVYDDLQQQPGATPSDTAAQLIDPLNPRSVELSVMPAAVATEFRVDGKLNILGNSTGSIKLPIALRNRLSYDPINQKLTMQGVFDESGAGEPLLLINVMSFVDRSNLLELDGDQGVPTSGKNCGIAEGDNCSWDEAVQALFRLSRNPNDVRKVNDNGNLRVVNDHDVLIAWEEFNPGHPTGDGVLSPFKAVGVSAALSAGASQGTGYMTLAFNNDPTLTPAPISLTVIRVDCLDILNDGTWLAPYQGQLQIITPDNVFDEQLTLRHSGDFGGLADNLEFDWYYKPDLDGTPPAILPDPDNGQMNGWLPFPVDNAQGAVEVIIQGANIQTLSDNWFVARYRGLPACTNGTNWSLYAGQPGATPLEQRAQLAEGWVKRVLKRLNPFEARVQNFAQAATNNYASMLVQLGERYEGDIALNSDPDNLNSIGLIEAYQTVMYRAMSLSVGSTPPVDYGPANAAILLVGSRLVDFYTLLGNEAYADAQDPTIGITIPDSTYDFGALAPTIFNFQNQVPDLLEEELLLLRGRSNDFGPVAANPVYNRAFWNFTTGDGEVAYALSYNISDQNNDGVIDEFDARILYPQGHGDAWGHYLTALDFYYDLLRHPFYSWDPRPEAITVAGAPITVDFLDERQFAETAAQKAKVGAEVVNLTYRSAYVEDPAGQWQGYKDTDTDQAWGVSGWAKRAGQAAYFDWVTANSIIPAEDNDPSHEGIQVIQRDNVTELDEIVAQASAIQQEIDQVDKGLNPLGLAKGVVPFDIDPVQVDQGKTHFEQVYERAETALDNVTQVWDYANQLNRMLRFTQESVDDINRDSIASEMDFRNRLVEIFGYPYDDDIGPGGVYPTDYNGPDIYHYMYIDAPQLAGTPFDIDSAPAGAASTNGALLPVATKRFTGVYQETPNGLGFFGVGSTTEKPSCSLNPLWPGCNLGTTNPDNVLEVEYEVMETPEFKSFVKPSSWLGSRRAQGKIQQILQDMVQAQVSLKKAYREYDNLSKDISDQVGTIEATYNVANSKIQIENTRRRTVGGIALTVKAMKLTAKALDKVGYTTKEISDTAADCVPKSLVIGLASGGDGLAPARCAVKAAGKIGTAARVVAKGLEFGASIVAESITGVNETAANRTNILDSRMDVFNLYGDLDKMIRQEPVLRAEVYAKAEALQQMQQSYYTTLAEGQRVMEGLIAFRRRGAAEVQEHRYGDMAFRIFRNDALQKYRASFDLAARYVYLAASAYDYETNLLGTDGQSGRQFLTDIVRERSIGQILNGEPVPGSRGLADSMAKMKLNFDVLKGQMGFNNPQVETNRFSMRDELYRILEDGTGDRDWQEILEDSRVDNLWAIPEFRRYARPFAPESAGAQPGLVIPFSTTVTFGLNFFGGELGAGDSSYDPTQFATKVRSVGVWFDGYDTGELSQTPRVYLIPVGADILRSPDAFDFTVRQWQIVDQSIPVPFPIGEQDLSNADWNPTVDSLLGNVEIRRFSQFRAYPFDAVLDDAQMTADSRLIGRSVWNRRWLLIIPGGNLLFDPDEGLDSFIYGAEIPDTNGQRDGNGVSDIKLFFKTYAYSGN